MNKPMSILTNVMSYCELFLAMFKNIIGVSCKLDKLCECQPAIDLIQVRASPDEIILMTTIPTAELRSGVIYPYCTITDLSCLDKLSGPWDLCILGVLKLLS